MKTQNYDNHSQYYTAHHFVFYPLILVLAIAGAYFAATASAELRPVWIFLTVITVVIGWLSFMLRQHYAITLQNRLIITELRYRYFSITGERLELLEDQFSRRQLFALRFASDEELAPLVKRAAIEKLDADTIKRSIQHWKGDYMRV